MFKLTNLVVSVITLSIYSLANASQLFIYTSPTGERIVTDHPINLKGYELEEHQISAARAGLALRYQNNAANRQQIDRYIRNASYLYGVDSALIKAVIRQESAFRIDAKSHKGAIGLMQLMPSTANKYKVTDIYDPKQNIYAGAAHLNYLVNRYASLELALAAYNAGEGAVSKYGGIPPYPETRKYIQQVTKWYKQYKK